MAVTVTQACDGEVYVTQVGNVVTAVTLTAEGLPAVV